MRGVKKLNICFIGSSQAGVIGALTVLAKNANIVAAVSYTDYLTEMLSALNIDLYKSINSEKFKDVLKKSDLLLSVHGREIVKEDLLRLPKYGAINLHPYLYKYKGVNPVERALKDGEFKASVGAHIMEGKVDNGRVLFEEFVDVSGSLNAESVYNKIYPSYCNVLLKVLDNVFDKKYAK